ncbi:MAG: hypothetical protein HY744_19500 [Deltaproteobacteria bacterium]|nr:hypothetical protein [Deltaproteobacteria bacterium]
MLVAALGAALCADCKKKEETEAVALPPRQGGASVDMVSTGIGSGLGLEADLAPTSTEWDQAFVLGQSGVVLVGRAVDRLVVLRSDDAGRMWYEGLQSPLINQLRSTLRRTGEHSQGACFLRRGLGQGTAWPWAGPARCGSAQRRGGGGRAGRGCGVVARSLRARRP